MKMQIDKVYGLYCYADNGAMYSPVFQTKREAIEHLDVFQDEILEENDNVLEADVHIDLLEIDLSNIDVLEQYACANTISTWEPYEHEDFYCWCDATIEK